MAFLPQATVVNPPKTLSPWQVQSTPKPVQQGVYYGPPQQVGLGYSYTPPIGAYGLPPGYLQPFSAAAGYIGQSSQQAAEALRRASEQSFAARAEGIAGARSEDRRRLGFEAGASGYSPELLRRMNFGLDADAQAQIGAARGESMAGFEEALAELTKGTGTELASLKANELGMLMQAYLAAKGRQAARKAGKNNLLGGIVGALGGVAGGFLGNPGLFANGGGGGGGGYADSNYLQSGGA